MSAMREMSAAIRHVLEDQADPGDRTLRSIPTVVLREIAQIVGAFHLDIRAEIDRRDALPPENQLRLPTDIPA